MLQSPLLDHIRQTREWRLAVAMLDLANRIHRLPSHSGDAKSVQKAPEACADLVRAAGHELGRILRDVNEAAKGSRAAREFLREIIGDLSEYQSNLAETDGMSRLFSTLGLKHGSQARPALELPDTLADELVISEPIPEFEFDTHIRAADVLRKGLRVAREIGLRDSDHAVRQAANEVFRELEQAAQIAPEEFKKDNALIASLQADCEECGALRAAHQRNGTPVLRTLLQSVNVTLRGPDGPSLSN